ncbi:MAG: aldo/keto reductase [Bacteroidota bacterium]
MLKPVKIAENGPTFSRIVFGVMKWGIWGWDYKPAQMLRLIEESIETGVTTFDHADIYGHYTTEATFGEAMKGQNALRDKMQIITKCGINLITPNRPDYQIKSYNTSKEHILASVENSLRDLHTDYIDLLLVHRPSPLMEADEVAAAFTSLKESGKVGAFGVSNFTPAQFDLLNSRFPLTSNQVQASILHLDPFLDGTLDQMQQHCLVPTAWSPLGGGMLFNELENPRVQRIRKVAQELSSKYEASGIDQILLAWLMRHPTKILPVVGTGRIERLKTAAAATNIDLSREDWFKLWEASTGEEVP